MGNMLITLRNLIVAPIQHYMSQQIHICGFLP